MGMMIRRVIVNMVAINVVIVETIIVIVISYDNKMIITVT